MNSEKIYNCNDCLYANPMEDGNVECDKRSMEKDIKNIITEGKVHLNCPSHSGYPILDWRYGSTGLLRDAEDACDVCARLVDLFDDSQYDYVDVVSEDSGSVTVFKCRICIEKGR